MTYNERLVAYLQDCPGTAVIAVPLGNLAAAGTIPNVAVIEHDAYFNEFRASDGTVIARVIFAD